MARLNQVQVKATYGQTLTDADNIESFAPPNSRTVKVPVAGYVYCYVNTMPQYSQGRALFHLGPGVAYEGLEPVTYTQSRMYRNTLSWLRTNYEGQVTAYLTKDSDTYARYNATLRFSEDPNRNEGNWLVDVQWIFTIVEAL